MALMTIRDLPEYIRYPLELWNQDGAGPIWRVVHSPEEHIKFLNSGWTEQEPESRQGARPYTAINIPVKRGPGRPPKQHTAESA
jgi:hypothetical protein